ncbi:hypothetical protein CALCODRAFT_511451 [Calocera cornea HHB12733]|uniref:Uncharacterized protein n=1 Tax=Calocera cornea HHB12733 TaxID=1353952 RepID=A0A165DRY3_9BASI|nr:hypothetical protein CALCODRAFT_511451 [Calocera cornea HHB12733]
MVMHWSRISAYKVTWARTGSDAWGTGMGADDNLTPEDDPRGDAKRIEDEWSVRSPIILGNRLSDGTIQCTSPLAFEKGDFVDVAFTVEIVKLKRGFVTNLVPEHLVRLASRIQTEPPVACPY